MILTRIKNNIAFIAKKACSITALIYAIIGFLGAFVSMEGIFSDKDTFWRKLLISMAILLGTYIVVCLILCIYVLFKNKKKVVEGRNGYAVYVKYGDLFNDNITGDSQERRSLCFAVNRCFDTIVDNNLVADTTIHGIAFNKLYQHSTFTPDSLNDAIQTKLQNNHGYVLLTHQDKPEGNLKRYAIGTCADLEVNDKLHYFLVGMSSYNETLTANTTLYEYSVSVQKMIDFCNQQSQGYPVVMPILGGGLSRTGVKENELLDYVISAFKLNSAVINCDIYIVIRESAKSTISIASL